MSIFNVEVEQNHLNVAQNVIGQFTENLKILYEKTFIQKFQEEEIDSNDLKDIDIEVLQSWGITKKFHQNKIIRILNKSIDEVSFNLFFLS